MTGAAKANDFFPYQENDFVTFQASNGGEREMSVQRTQGAWTQLAGFLGLGQQWVYSEEDDNRLWVYNAETGYGELLVDLDGVPGMSFDSPLGVCQNSAIIDDRELTITTPAGRFEGVVRVDFSGNCADAGLGSVWFAPQVGVVRYTEQSIVGPVTFELSGASLGDTLLPASNEVSVAASFPVGRVFAAERGSMKVGLTVANEGSQAMELMFPSSQRFDVLIFDANDRLVRQWSANKRFTQAVEYVSIAPGASRFFGTDITLTTDTGATLDVGTYIMRIELTGYVTPDASVFSDQRMSIEVPLHIDGRMSTFN
jgi:hypothetical protein